jgi:hypothetical protein
MNKRSRGELIEKLEKLEVSTGFVKIYKMEYTWKGLMIGEQKKKGIDEDHAFVI